MNTFKKKLRHALRIDRALRFVWAAAPGYTFTSGLVIATLGFLPILNLYLMRLIIDSVSDSISNVSKPPPVNCFNDVVFFIFFVGAASLLAALLNSFSYYLKKAQGITVTDYMFSVLQRKSLEIDLAHFDSPQYKNILHQAQREGPYRPTSIVNGLTAAGQSAFSFAAVVCLFFVFNPVFPFLMIAAALPGVWLRLVYSKKIFAWQQNKIEDERRAFYFNWILTSDISAKEVRLFNTGKYFIDRFKSIRDAFKYEKLSFERKRALYDFVGQSIITVVVFISFVHIAMKTINGLITIGEMVMYLHAFQKGLGYLKELLENIANMYEDNLFLSNFYELFKIEPHLVEPEMPVTVPRILKKGIEFKNVKFSYQHGHNTVIRCVNFSISPGEIVALVGENGSGKSTIVKLLARLYDPEEGKILFDGHDIKTFKISEYRKKISTLFQDYIKYHLSAKENIYIGDINKKDNLQQIINAAKAAQADEKISSLPLGYDSILGTWFKGGEELSTGQWQMIAIARAFFREGEIVILDEPSSALDPEIEKQIFLNLKKLIKGRSVLMVSHRYSTVCMADKIIMMDSGMISEQGTHADLMEKNGKYASFYNAYCALHSSH